MRTPRILVFLLLLFCCFGRLLAQEQASEKAKTLIQQAREAIGGEANLNAIQSLTIQGNFKSAMMGRPMQGDLKLEFLMPDKYLRTTSISSQMGTMQILQCVNSETVWTDRKMPEMTAGGGGMGEGGGGFGGGGGGGGMGGGGGGGFGGGGGGGGMGGAGRRGGGGMGLPQVGGQRRDSGGGIAGPGMQKMIRTEYSQFMLGVLLTPPANFNVEYAYDRELDAKDGKADAIRVLGPDNFIMWVLLDQKSHRPVGYIYRTTMPRRQDVTDAREAEEPKPMDVQVFFDEYKQIDKLFLPYHIVKATNGQSLEDFKISKIKLNETIKARKFEKKS